jgi:hypothetical protein
MRWIAAGVMFCLSASAQAKELCGRGSASSGRLELTVLASQEGSAPRVTYVYVQTSNPDGSYRLSVGYDPTDAGLGAPTSAEVQIVMPVPDPERAEPEQVMWRAGSGPWFNPGYWSTPRRTFVDPKETRGSVGYGMAQAPVLAYRAELLQALDGGVSYEFKRIDRSGREIGSGSVDYPPSQRIAELYDKARRQALAKLRPCGNAPPMTSAPAPSPPAPPPAPDDRASIEAGACAFFSRQEKEVAERNPQAGRRTKIVEQTVDCDRRSVRRVYEMDSFQERDKREFGATIQNLSDKTWCAAQYLRRLIGWGWTFRLEIRGRGDPAVIAATTDKCSG